MVHERNAKKVCQRGFLRCVGLFLVRCFIMTAHGVEASIEVELWNTGLKRDRAGSEKHSKGGHGTGSAGESWLHNRTRRTGSRQVISRIDHSRMFLRPSFIKDGSSQLGGARGVVSSDGIDGKCRHDEVEL